MIEVGDERVLWLDPRWAANKGFLADEGVALRLVKEDGVQDDAKADPAATEGVASIVIEEKDVLPLSIASLPQMYHFKA